MHSYMRARQEKHVQCEASFNCNCRTYSSKKGECAFTAVLAIAGVWNSLWRCTFAVWGTDYD